MKLFLREMNHLLVLKWTLDLQNDLQVSREIIQPEETSNYDHPDNEPTKNNRAHIKNSKYSKYMFLLTESQRKINLNIQTFQKIFL